MPPAIPVIGVLALQGDVPEHLRALEAVGGRPVPVRRPEELGQIDGLVIPGGESSTMSKLIAAYELEGPIRRLYESGAPLFGTCAGMILLAGRVLGGRDDQRTFPVVDLTVRRNGSGPIPPTSRSHSNEARWRP